MVTARIEYELLCDRDSTGECVVSGVVAAGMVLFDAAIVILAMALAQVS
jgi:hypothetical protein